MALVVTVDKGLRGGGEDLFFAPGKGKGRFAEKFDNGRAGCTMGFRAASATAFVFYWPEVISLPARAGSISFYFAVVICCRKHYNTYVKG